MESDEAFDGVTLCVIDFIHGFDYLLNILSCNWTDRTDSWCLVVSTIRNIEDNEIKCKRNDAK